MANPTFGAHVRAWRKESGLTQKQLAQKVGVSQQAIADWEQEASRPTAEPLLALAEAMGVAPRDLTAMATKADHNGFAGGVV